MSNDPVDGGTVTYHYKEYRAGSDHPWCIWFTADAALDEDAAVRFTAAEGRAMGLTPPEPAPLVVTCNGHSVELSDEEAATFVYIWKPPTPSASLYDTASSKLAGLLRDARQDPRGKVDVGGGAADREAVGPTGTTVQHSASAGLDTSTPSRQDSQPASDPAPLSPGECLRGLLAGREDADELIEYAAHNWPYKALHGATNRLRGAVGDAAREVHG